MRAIFYLLKDFPFRCDDYIYTHLSSSIELSQKFYVIRWAENGKVIERAIKIIPNLKSMLTLDGHYWRLKIISHPYNNNKIKCKQKKKMFLFTFDFVVFFVEIQRSFKFCLILKIIHRIKLKSF